MQRVDALADLIATEAVEAERVRHLTDDMFAELKRAGLPHLLTPRELGGSQLSYAEGMQICERISAIDGSTGWCLMVANIQNGSAGAYLPSAGLEEVFINESYTNIAGQGIPRGLAWPVDGGYNIRGDWSYGSGIHHANWIHSGCIIMDGEQPKLNEHGLPITVICYITPAEIQLKDNWDVIGLRGTGSFDYSISKDLFVPEHRTHLHSKTKPERGGHEYCIGITGFTAWGHTSFALGVGRHALDEAARIAREKGGPFGLVADGASFQEKYARAEAKVRSVRAFVYETWNRIDDTLRRGELLSNEMIALARLGNRYSHEVMSEVSTFAYNIGGGVALRPSELQRCYRDMHAGLQHILLADKLMQDCGKVLMGHVDPNASWDILGIH